MIRMIERSENGAYIRTVYDPRDFDKEEKEEARDRKRQYQCCCRKDIVLIYRFSSNIHFNPEHQKPKHAQSCGLSELYNKAVCGIRKIQNTGEYDATIRENLSKPPNRKPPNRERRDKEGSSSLKEEFLSDKENPVRQARVSSLIKRLNLDTSRRQTTWKLKIPKSILEFNQCVWRAAEDTAIHHYGKERKLNNTTDADCRDRFIYNSLYNIKLFGKDLTEYDFSIPKLMETLKKSGKDTFAIIAVRILRNEREETRSYPVTRDGLYYALKHYKGEYGTDIIDPQSTNLTVTGFSYPGAIHTKRENTRNPDGRGIDRLWLFRTCSHGIYVESSYEADAFDLIFSIIDGMDDVHFYKPDIFSREAYEDGGFLEDGVLIVDGSEVRGILEVFGIKGNEQYEKTKAWKRSRLKALEKEGSHVSIEWDPANGEPIELLGQRVSDAIDRIRAAKHKYSQETDREFYQSDDKKGDDIL